MPNSQQSAIQPSNGQQSAIQLSNGQQSAIQPLNGQQSAILPFPSNCSNADLKGYLEKIYNFAIENTQKSIDWYIRSAKTNRRYAQYLRFLAILFVALAGIG